MKIESIEYPERQKVIDVDYDAKGVRLDVYVQDVKGTVYNIEMQALSTDNLPKRSRYYQGMIDLNLLEKGAHYSELNQSYVIFVCNFDLFKCGRHLYTFENICLQDKEICLKDETTKIFLNAKGTMNDVSDELKAFLNYVSTGEVSDDKFVNAVDQAVKSARENKEWRREYMTQYMRELEIKMKARADGKVISIISQIRKKIVKGLSCEVIADMLETDVEMVEKIVELIKENPSLDDEMIYAQFEDRE